MRVYESGLIYFLSLSNVPGQPLTRSVCSLCHHQLNIIIPIPDQTPAK